RIFNSSLSAFDQRVEDYRADRISLGVYLSGQAIDAREYPSVERFSQALKLESKLNFARVESQRTQLISRLLAKLDPHQHQNFIATAAAYRSGRIGHADFYRSLRRLCEQSGVALTEFLEMETYFRYTLLAGEIDADKVLAETQAWEKSRYEQLAKT